METNTGKDLEIINNDSAQIGSIFYVVIAVAVVGFLYIILGGVMNAAVEQNNDMIDHDVAYSADRYDAMNAGFAWWYWIPVIFIILIAVYAIWAGLSDKTGGAY